MRPQHVTISTALLLLVVSACSKSQDADDQGPAAKGPPGLQAEEELDLSDDDDDSANLEGDEVDDDSEAPEKSLTAEVMRAHFSYATDARNALVRADLPKAKETMAWLATHDLGVVIPAELAPLQASMQAAAKTFGDAKNLREAGVALATTLARCGECHKRAGKGPNIASEPVPDAKDVPGHMKRHHWAIHEAWSGLVTASAERFEAAAEIFDEAPLPGKTLAPGSKEPDKLSKLAQHVHALGKEMKSATDDAKRVKAFGHMLATCAGCHRLVGAGPQPTYPVE